MRPVILVFVAGCIGLAQPHAGPGSVPGPGFGAFNAIQPQNRSAQPPGHILTPPPVAHQHHGRSVVAVPYPVYYYGGYYGFGYDSAPLAPQQQQGYYNDPGYADQSQPPVVIINQNYRPEPINPVIHDYTNTPLPESTLKKFDSDQTAAVVVDAEPTIYLIAMRDHTIFPALAYWVEGDTLNYITTEGVHNRATLDLVDRDFSKQLNDERHIQFKLPVPIPGH